MYIYEIIIILLLKINAISNKFLQGTIALMPVIVCHYGPI